MSLLQAMSVGVPAIVTDVGGMAGVVRLSGGGLLAPVGDATPGAIRARYLQAAERLAARKERTADEAADLGGLYLRLGEVNKALAVLRPAQREHPTHYRLASNLGVRFMMLSFMRRTQSLDNPPSDCA